MSLRALALAALLSACKTDSSETTTHGRLDVVIGESIAPALVPAIAEFLKRYQERGANVTYSVVPSAIACQRFLHDTVRMIISTVPIQTHDRESAAGPDQELVDLVLAYDGVVGVVHQKNNHKEMTLEQLRDILNGSITKWEQLGGKKNQRGPIKLVLQDSSDVSSYLSERLLSGNRILIPYTRTLSSLETIAEIEKNGTALGFVGLGWIDSSRTTATILKLGAGRSLADTHYVAPSHTLGEFYAPLPAHLYRNYYPMKRAIYLYARSRRGDFAAGFASFLASADGQRIFLRKGLLPGTQKILLKTSNY
jgi:phosphate transport system substrate-binding protein